LDDDRGVLELHGRRACASRGLQGWRHCKGRKFQLDGFDPRVDRLQLGGLGTRIRIGGRRLDRRLDRFGGRCRGQGR
jgi:hypothetical protein